MNKVIILLITIFVPLESQFLDLLSNAEKYVTLSASRLNSLYNRKCQLHSDCKDSCTFRSCSLFDSQYEVCTARFKTATANESGCSDMSLLRQSTFVQADSNTQSDIINEDLCWTSPMDEEMYKFAKENEYVKWQMIGTDNIVRRFPGGLYCDKYDHRIRNWWLASVRKPINIVFALDTSGIMNNGFKKELLKLFMSKTLESLDQTSWIGIIPFGQIDPSSAEDPQEQIFKKEYKKLDQAFKSDLQGKINLLEFKGDFKLKENKIRQFIENSEKLKLGANCNSNTNNSKSNTLIVYLLGNENIEIEEEMTPSDRYSRLFITLRAKENPQLKKLACDSKDVVINIESLTEIDSVLRTFHSIISADVLRNSPVWTTYKDAFGLSDMLTVSKPVYFKEMLVGVFAVSFEIEALKKMNDYSEDLKNYYIVKAEDCVNVSSLSDCRIEQFRSLENQCFSYDKAFRDKCQAELADLGLTTCEEFNTGAAKNFICEREKPKDLVGYTNCCVNSTNEDLLYSVPYSRIKVNEEKPAKEEEKPDDKTNTTSNETTLVNETESKSNSTIVNETTETPDDTKEGNPIDDTPDDSDGGNSNLYIVLLVVLLIIVVVIYYMHNKSERSYYGSGNRELTMQMAESSRRNYSRQ